MTPLMDYALEQPGSLLSPGRHCLSSLLPYDPAVKTGKRLQDGLKEFRLLLTLAQGAMEALEKGELRHFDPLVGENACQIRALKVALIAYNRTVDIHALVNQIAQSKSKVEELLTNLPITELSLKHYLENEGLDIQMSDDELFLLKSYALTKTKITKPFKPEKPLVENATTDAKKMKELSSVGSAFSWDFVRHLREKLSASSVNFVQELACPQTKMVFDEFSVIHNGLKCIPYYWTAKVLMKQALLSQIPIVMVAEQKAKDRDYAVIEKATLFFQPTEQGYQATSLSSLEPHRPALILIGTTCRNLNDLPIKEDWINELLEYCPIELILAYAAAHRQYPDESKDSLVTKLEDKNYLYHKTKAEEWGCSLENPALFFLSHAFCEKVSNVQALI